MKKPIIVITLLLTSFTAFCQVQKKDSIPTMTITLTLQQWDKVSDIILKTNVPTQQFLEAYNVIVVPFQNKVAELDKKQKK